jgi:hypothetical protein
VFVTNVHHRLIRLRLILEVVFFFRVTVIQDWLLLDLVAGLSLVGVVERHLEVIFSIVITVIILILVRPLNILTNASDGFSSIFKNTGFEYSVLTGRLVLNARVDVNLLDLPVNEVVRILRPTLFLEGEVLLKVDFLLLRVCFLKLFLLH